MYYVYILQSIHHPGKTYIGLTPDIANRLNVHNQGGSIYTAKFKPWKLIGYVALEDKAKAVEFEAYLKIGSGKAFITKHFL